MKFTAKALTLEITVTELGGNERTFSTPPLNANKACALLDKMIADEKAFNDLSFDKDKPTVREYYKEALDFVDSELSDIYGTERGYWKENFDRATLKDIKKYIVDELNGVQKNV